MSISRITINIFRSLSKNMVSALQAVGVEHMTQLSGRSPVIQESKGILAKLSGSGELANDPSEILTFLIPSDQEDAMISYVIEKGQLHLQGRGSVHADHVDVPKANEACEVNKPTSLPEPKHPTLKDAAGICCIVQRGQGERIARVVLDSGAGVPGITFGSGLGVRDKMGLLRITIPAEKELVWVATSDFDADIIMNSMIEIGQLDKPGKGFIYSFPISQAHLNMRVTLESGRSAASMEQIIAAIDSIKGNIDWRRRAAADDDKGRTYLKELVEFTLVCDEGGGDPLVAAAMASGAAGASISKLKQLSPKVGSGKELISKSRESCYMIIGKNALPDILEALEKAEAFSDKYHGIAISLPTHKAFTYLPPAKK